jgi:hypothetical protein
MQTRLARLGSHSAQWRVDDGTYEVAVDKAADALELFAGTTLAGTLSGG